MKKVYLPALQTNKCYFIIKSFANNYHHDYDLEW